MLINGFERAGDGSLRLATVLLGAVIVDVKEHLLIRQASGLAEGALELSELIFTGRRGGVKHKDNSIGALLNRTPAFLIAPIARHIPKFNVNFSEDAG